jgi:undecaprenyl pyrophosphate phosphatase UppP
MDADIDIDKYQALIETYAIPWGIKLIAAIAIFIIGRIVAKLIVRLIKRFSWQYFAGYFHGCYRHCCAGAAGC